MALLRVVLLTPHVTTDYQILYFFSKTIKIKFKIDNDDDGTIKHIFNNLEAT